MNSVPATGGSWAHAILDEIALEGLEGVTLTTLWSLLASRFECSLPLPAQFQQQIWSYILRCYDKLDCFLLPEERGPRKFYERFVKTPDEPLGVPVAPLEDPYSLKFVPRFINEICGSCEHFEARKLLKIEDLLSHSVESAQETWGNKLVIVASQELRYEALTPPNVPRPKDLTAVQYALWELIGRSRFNGEATSGPFSLQTVYKDPSLLFYIKNKLVRLNILTQQNFNERRGERFFPATLLLLPRFSKARKSFLQIVIEKIFLAIQKSPLKRISTAEARELLPSIEQLKSLKRFLTMHLFLQVFETFNVPYAEVHKESKAKDKKLLMIRLRDANLTFAQLQKISCDEKVEKPIEFFSNKHSFIDMPITEEAYRAVERHGSRGVSSTELTMYMGIHHLTARTLIKYLDREKLIKHYNESVGRQRFVRYVTALQAEEVNKDQMESLELLQNLSCNEEPNIQPKNNFVIADVPAIEANLRLMLSEYRPIKRDRTSKRQIARQALIVRLINEKCVIQMMEIKQAIQKEEKTKGYTDEVCRKSIVRILQTLRDNQVVNCYELTLKYQNCIRLYRFVTHPKIVQDHEVLKHEILRLKNNLYLMIEERQRVPKSAKSKSATAATTKKKYPTMNVSAIYKTKPPKLFLAREIHQFLFYILMELHVDQMPLELSEELLQQWQNTEPELNATQYFEEWQKEEPKPLPFSDEINWRTFIPPLPRYEDKPAGWVFLKDALERMPLSVFNKLFRIERYSDDVIQSYLKHPVRQHYLMRQLPPDSQCLITRLRLKVLYINSLRVLNHMGLVQVTERAEMIRDPLLVWVYINRHTRLLETTTSEPGYHQINAQREYTCLKFDLIGREDVVQYWSNLQRICVYTKLGYRRKRVQVADVRYKALEFLGSVDFEQALQQDNGTVPGDNLGAAGLDSHLYAYQFRHWSWVVQGKQHQTSETAAKTRRDFLRFKQRRLRANLPPMRRAKASGVAGKKRHVPAVTASNIRISRKKGPRDDVDREALRNMRTLRGRWSPEEDKVLKLARAVYLYISAPILLLGLLHVGCICRDVIRQRLGICNKTSEACVRRMQFLVRKKRDVPEVQNWLYMLQSNAELNQTYGAQFLFNLKTEYAQKHEQMDALFVHFLLILHKLTKWVDNTSSLGLNNFMLPDNLTEYRKSMREIATVAENEGINHTNPCSIRDLQITITQCVLHSSMCSARDKTLYNLQAFEIYKHFSEEVLHLAFAKARMDSWVVGIKRRNLQSASRQISGPAFFLSSKYRNRLNYLKIPYSIYDAYNAYYQNALTNFFGQSLAAASTSKDKLAMLELKSPTFAQLLFIGESIARDYVSVDFKLPANILTVDMSERQQVCAADRILDHFSNFFDNAPQTEYDQHIDYEGSNKQMRVKFQPANLSYKVNYSPYDYISKLQQRYLHFFCALDHLQQPVDINFSKLQRRDDEGDIVVPKCPFNCILSSGNYVNAIERIVHEKKSAIKELQAETAPQKLLNQATSGNAIVVQTSNLLTLVRMLETFWQEKEATMDRRDFGRMTNLKTTHKAIDWPALCTHIIEYDPNECEANEQLKDYEPTLNKEGSARAQDVFVVSLPTLQFQLSEKFKSMPRTHLHDIEVPAVLLEGEMQQKTIIEKVMNESYWKYTEHSFDTLRPILVKLKYNELQQQHMKDILEFIESHTLGVTVSELKLKFPIGEFLITALHHFINHYLVKRVGVSSYLYIHKKYMREWVVHTFHLKRLERESISPAMANSGDIRDASAVAVAVAHKRKLSQDIKNEDEQDSSDSGGKRSRLNSADSQPSSSAAGVLGKRQSRAPERFDGDTKTADSQATAQAVRPGKTLMSEVARNVIVIRPQPWMRLNGSLNRRVLDRWLSSILSECITHTGCTVYDLFTRFPPMLPVDIMFLLELLCDLNCMHLMEMHMQSYGLESLGKDEYAEELVTEFYEPTMTYMVVHSDAVGRLSNFIGTKKYNLEFI